MSYIQLRSANLLSRASLTTLVAALFADLETQLRQVDGCAGSSTVQEFLTTLGRSVAPSQGVDYLNELISLMSPIAGS